MPGHDGRNGKNGGDRINFGNGLGNGNTGGNTGGVSSVGNTRLSTMSTSKTPLPLVTPTQDILTSSSTALSSTSTGGLSYNSTGPGQPSISPTSRSTPRSTASVPYNADSSSETNTVSIGVLPNGTSSITSTKSDSNAGVIAGVVILAIFILLMTGFLLQRRRIRRRNRLAPSAQYLADHGPPPSRGSAFFRRRGDSQYYDISHFHISSIWPGTNSQSGHSHTPKNPTSPSLSGHATGRGTEENQTRTDEPEMREHQSWVDRINVGSSQSISGKSSIGAAAGHSPLPDNPFADLEPHIPVASC